MEQLREIGTAETIFFGGIAEPLSHPDILTMVRLAKETGRRVELISNGSLLTEETIEALLKAGLDMLWVSLDREHRESQEEISGGTGGYDPLVKTLAAFRRKRPQIHPEAELGIAFVATKSNIAELPEILEIGSFLGASEIKVSNLIPYTREMQKEVLYARTLSCGSMREETGSPRKKLLSMPIMDFELLPPKVLLSVLRDWPQVQLGKNRIVRDAGHCKFIEEESLYVRWDGEVSPCMAMLHTNRTYLQNVERLVHHHSFGNIKEENLKLMWEKEDYESFRRRVLDFSFSPCTICGICEYAEENQEDCFGNQAPTCGACLWSEGFAQCP
jgi:MoaA/NifB/PqqE/SkfB family radical SAM enzyme